MVDVSGKDITTRRAIASGKVLLSAETLSILKSQTNPKGDPLEIARIAGIMGAKKTSELIPLCHQLNLSKVNVTAEIREDGIYLEAEAITDAKTGVEMEASDRGFSRGVDDLRHVQGRAEGHRDYGIQVEHKGGGKDDYSRP
jgi:cyclic pyranopterin phosphate synthase